MLASAPHRPFTVSFADHLGKLGLAVARLLPIHGRTVPLADMQRTIGR